MCNIGIFTALVSSRPNILRTGGILRTLSNIYDGPFSSESKTYSEYYQTSVIRMFYSKPFVTLTYSEP